jgi:hypothetical protein
MSPTSYLTAPPRVVTEMLAMQGLSAKPNQVPQAGLPKAVECPPMPGERPAEDRPSADSARVGVIDIGTNSTRLLVADVTDHRVT